MGNFTDALATPVSLYAPVHARVYARRIRVLADQISELIAHGASVLDVGSGDGQLAGLIADKRTDLRFRGVDVLVRPDTRIPVQAFDGTRLPFGDGEFDVVMMIDVLHHAARQMELLRETARVARQAVIIKDHVVQGLLARQTLSVMDWIGNARYGVALPYAYWTSQQWRDNLATAGLRVVTRRDKLRLYPWPASLLFDRDLHFIAVLARST